MRGLLWIAGVIVVLWGGWWFTGRTVLTQGAAQALSGMQADGMTAEADVSVSGFPNRWDLTAEGLRLGDPENGALWQAPFVQVFAMTWKPWHIIAAFAPEQTITLQGQTLTLQSLDLMASVRAAPALDLPLAETRVAGTSLTLAADTGWRIGLGEFTVALRADEARGPAAYELGFDLAPLSPDPAFLAAVRSLALPGLPAPSFPDAVETLWGQVFVTLSAPIDRFVGDRNPYLTKLEIAETHAAWGDLSLSAKGTLEADTAGFASGRITIDVTNWDRLPALLVATGAVEERLVPTVTGMLRALAAQSPDAQVLSLPLVFADGKVSFGPFPLGPAPRLIPPSG